MSIQRAGHLETIWAAKIAKPHWQTCPVNYLRQRWHSPDSDFIDVDFLDSRAPPTRPLWVMFHGLEGSSRSHYALAFARYAQENQFHFCVPHFRGCSGEVNWAARAYHSGDWQEIEWILQRMRKQHKGEIYVIGVSLGGNALMRWAGEVGDHAKQFTTAVVSICSPLDLMSSGKHIGSGLNRYIYTPIFLRTLKPYALQKLKQYPKLFDKEKMLASRDLYDFDNVVTAPLHGFKNTHDYWTKASALPHLHNIHLPALIINARNDPFIPTQSLPQIDDMRANIRLWQPNWGGHVGFVKGVFSNPPGHLQTLPRVVDDFFVSGETPHG